MNFNSILAALKPKEDKFFPMLINVGENLSSASKLFIELVNCGDMKKALELKTQIKTLEKTGDKIQEEILNELNNSFITPFDREDIHTLSEHLDNILDTLNSLSKRIVLYQPTSMQSHLEEASVIINNCCDSLLVILKEMKNLQKNPSVMLDECKKIHEYEQQGDDLYDATTARIFSESTDAIEVIKDKGIMSYVENTIDETYTVSKLVKTMIVKYA